MGPVRPNFRLGIDVFLMDTAQNVVREVNVAHPRLKKETPGTANVQVLHLQLAT